MMTFLIATLLVALVGLIARSPKRDHFDEYFFTPLENFFFRAILIYICAGGFWFIGAFYAERIEVNRGPIELAAVKTSTGISGAFVLGSGSVSSISYYRVLVRNQDGSVTPHQIPVDSNLRIIEDKTLSGVGYWSWTNLEPHEGTYRWTARPPIKKIRNELRVPEGSIVYSFEVN
ncbi:MAG: hypothetical protein KC652_26760 [Cyanobacteria bacterium HKST-UBA01]|nr:hypothetical protein [Cyanobacteria bacterium HKST-UBA01]